MYKVLIADDETKIRQGLHYIVDWNALGFSIIGEASNGEEALHFMLKNTPDVVLIDIHMPKLFGLDVIKRARSEGFKGKVIILSGYSDFKYAQEAIKQDVKFYLTKPVEENDLTEILQQIHMQLTKESQQELNIEQYRKKAKTTILKDLLMGHADFTKLDYKDINLSSDIYQVVICEKYSHNAADSSYLFSDLLMVTNQDNASYDTVTIDNNEIILLKSNFAIKKFVDFLNRYEREKKPQKGSPLDSLFITYGRRITSLNDIHFSFEEAFLLLQRRFFCEQGQHTIGYDQLPIIEKVTYVLNDDMLQHYSELLINYIQTFNRNMVAHTLNELVITLYNTKDDINRIKIFLTDLYLRIKEKLYHLYNTINIPFPTNSWIMEFIGTKYYLYEIILFFTEQFEMIMSSIGNSSRDSILDDIIHYIDHNYMENIKLENIAPLFGYNSSYLGKIFRQKIGKSFNSYVDYVRINHSKILLEQDALKVYEIAMKVGYRNVDYFHMKFKKYVGESPAEYRKNFR